MALPAGVAELIPAYLGRQRWYAGSADLDPAGVAVVDADELAVTGDGRHRLLWAIVAVRSGTEVRYQLLIGERPRGRAGRVPQRARRRRCWARPATRYYYDATLDPELARALLGVITDGAETAERVRPVSAEQSNTSLVYDDRLILKVFRRLLEAATRTSRSPRRWPAAGFAHVAEPVAAWRRDGVDLAFVQQFLAGGSEGWALALTSLRDLYSSRVADPAEAGGDFCAEADRLGQMTAEMHLALAEAFGVEPGGFPPVGWPAVLDDIEARLRPLVGAAWPARPPPCSTSCAPWTIPAPPSGSTATTTWVRSCGPTPAGTSSTSRASRPGPWPSGRRPRRRSRT